MEAPTTALVIGLLELGFVVWIIARATRRSDAGDVPARR